MLAFGSGSAASDPPPHPPHRHVYVIGPLIGLQKVGLAMDPKARLATLQTACPFDLFCTSRLPSRSARRTRLSAGAHRLLARSCVRTEWLGSPKQASA